MRRHDAVTHTDPGDVHADEVVRHYREHVYSETPGHDAACLMCREAAERADAAPQ